MGYTETEAIENKRLVASITKWSTLLGILILAIVIGCMIGCPQYKVYQQSKAGEAKLREAESSRQIVIQEAKAKLESAKMLADADTIRANGVATSNKIIGVSLKDNEAYLHWLWIDNIEKNPQAVIYVPTEANLPILEAGRLLKNKETP